MRLELYFFPAALIVVSVVACAAPMPSNDLGTGKDDGTNTDDLNGGDTTGDDIPTTPSQQTQSSTVDAAPAPAAAASDAGTDAASAPDTSTTTTKLPIGQTCTKADDCADAYCLPYKNKGLRCTKACTKDSDCPSNSCNDTPQVCDI